MTLTERFLRAKHWQIFLLVFGVPVLFQMIMLGAMIAIIGTDVSNGGQPDPQTFMGSFFAFFALLMVIVGATFFGWFWSIGIGLQEKIPVNARMKTGMFKVCFFFPLIYITIFVIGMAAMMFGLSSMIENNVQPAPAFIFGSMAIIFPLHLFAMFCMFYCLYFVAKTFKTVELQRATAFSDFAGEFFMFWFYPVGIWIIQPKINKMVEND
jgi:ABC-type multidrug transport system fused ATPase/permease subunit